MFFCCSKTKPSRKEFHSQISIDLIFADMVILKTNTRHTQYHRSMYKRLHNPHTLITIFLNLITVTGRFTAEEPIMYKPFEVAYQLIRLHLKSITHATRLKSLQQKKATHLGLSNNYHLQQHNEGTTFNFTWMNTETKYF